MTKGTSRRQRRREFAILMVLLAAALVAVAGVSGGSETGQRAASASRPSPKAGAVASAARKFVQEPYLGVSCHIPNSIACDRVGLAVWLARPAIVTATIAGARLRLDDPTWSYVAHRAGKPLYVYAGFLQPAGLTTRLHVVPIGGTAWLGAQALTPLVRFRIDYGGGSVVITQQHVWLHAGWG